MAPYRFAALAMLLAMPLAAAPSAQAASFDCGAAKTPFERAICDYPELSRADEVLAKSYATAIGGLTETALDALRSDQRRWLDFAERACTDTAEPMETGSFDGDAAACLTGVFQARSTALEQSRMLGGHRFYVLGIYGAVPDPNEMELPDSNWKVATHELVFPLLDEDEPLAEALNAYLYGRVDGLAQTAINPDLGDVFDPSSDTSVTIAPEAVVGTKRISFETMTYWYGHGAAHGNYTLGSLHYYVPEAREVVAEDIFAGKKWQDELANAAWAQLQIEHKDWLMVEDVSEIVEMVIDPTRWDLSNDYGLVIQFQPYDVSAYAYGAPTITIPWDRLEAIKAETQESIRFGY